MKRNESMASGEPAPQAAAPRSWVSGEGSGSLAPTASASTSRADETGGLVRQPRRSGFAFPSFATGLIVGLACAMPLRWALATHRSAGHLFEAAAPAPPNDTRVAPSAPTPPPLLPAEGACPVTCPAPAPSACPAPSASLASAGARAPGRAKGRKGKKPRVEAAPVAAASPGAESTPAPAPTAVDPAFVQAARKLIDHMAETELSEQLK